MTTFEQKSGDAFSSYGMAHFFQKFGVSFEEFSRRVDVVECGDFRDKIVSWVDTPYGEIPLFEELQGDSYFEVTDGRLRVNFDVFSAVGHILSGHFENLRRHDMEDVSAIPVVDAYEQLLFDALCSVNGTPVPRKPFWPQNKRFAVCLTHDVDEVRKTYQYFTRAAKHMRNLNPLGAAWQLAYSLGDRLSGMNPYWTFNDIMDLEDKLGVKSSFYFLQEDAEVKLSDSATWHHHARKYRFDDLKVTGIMRKLVSRGWEVGLHGSYNSYKNKHMLKKEKIELEEALGSPVTGTRQHHLNLEIPNTWRMQEACGLQYDTSLGFKAATRLIGFRWGTCFPFHPLDEATMKPLSILEIPMIIMDTTLFSLPQEKAWDKCMKIIGQVERFGGVATLLWHHSVLGSDYPGWTEFYKNLVVYCKAKDALVATGKEINDLWRRR